MSKEILDLLKDVSNGKTTPEEALLKLKKQPFEEGKFATIDYHRHIRQGASEIIYGKDKTDEQIFDIVKNMVLHGENDIIITRLRKSANDLLASEFDARFFEVARIGVVNRTQKELYGNVAVVSAGTSDIAVCEEAAITAELLGSRVTRIYDVGVSGLHRLLARLDDIMSAKAIVAVAGMEGALASVVGGLADCPVIAVPTSVGYGANFGGLSALLAMLNSCASGVAVVNIDNGFGAGYLADMINSGGAK